MPKAQCVVCTQLIPVQGDPYGKPAVPWRLEVHAPRSSGAEEINASCTGSRAGVHVSSVIYDRTTETDQFLIERERIHRGSPRAA